MYDHYMLTRSAEDAYFYSLEKGKRTRRISEALGALSKEDRRLIVKSFWGNKTLGELSDELGISPSEVEERLNAIYPVLREMLKEE